jgi:hypothetical protein
MGYKATSKTSVFSGSYSLLTKIVKIMDFSTSKEHTHEEQLEGIQTFCEMQS